MGYVGNMGKSVLMRYCMVVVLCIMAATGQAQRKRMDRKTALQVMANTTAAKAQEKIYTKYNDTILSRSTAILASSLIKMGMKNMDMDAREDMTGLERTGLTYMMLVDETGRLIAALADYLKNVKHYPYGTVACYKSAASIMLEAKGLIKEAVVVGFGGKVPNPFKVNKDSLAMGKDNTPSYNEDNSDKNKKGEKANDGDNLLLPDERYRIIDNTIERIRNFRQVTVAATWKLKTYYGWREALWDVSPYWAMKVDNVERAVNIIEKEIERIPGW